MIRRAATATLLGSIIGVLAAAGPVAAAPVVVTNLGQPGMVSTVPQPPETVVSRGTCREARTLEEANGAASPCPAGTWPVPGSAWGPSVEVVRGDVLALDFETAPDDVRVALTSNHPVGLMTPPYPGDGPGDPGRPGDPVPNVAYGPAAVMRDPDSAPRWLVTVPDDGRSSWAHLPMYAALSVRTAEGGDNHVLTLSPGRWVAYGSDCGEIWRDPGAPTPFCPRDIVPPGIPLPPKGLAPALPTGTAAPAADPIPGIGTARRAPIRTGRPAVRWAGRALRVAVPGTTPGTLRIRATWRGRTLGTATRTVRGARSVVVRLPLARAHRRLLRDARRPALRIVTTATVPGGRTAARRTTVVALAGR